MSVAAFEQRIDPGQIQSVALAVLVHVLLALVLVLGVRWQNKPPETVAVELWEPPATPPPVEVKPEPPPPAPPQATVPPKPEPVIEKPDIALKAPPKPKPVPKVEPKPPPKPVAKVEPPKAKPPSDAEAQKRLREELAREQAVFAANKERNDLKDRQARETAAANAKAIAAWKARVVADIHGRIRKEVAEEVPGNPEAVFLVTILPSYEVQSIQRKKSSGNRAYDDEVERAIRLSSPLPRPDTQREQVEDELRRNNRVLELTFRPKRL